MTISSERRGTGKPLLLVHGLGNTRNAWTPVLPQLMAGREVILLDLPGHGESPAEHDSGTFLGLVRSIEAWLASESLKAVPMVGSSLGGRIVLELARRGLSGPVLALDPGGFWQGWERTLAGGSLTASALLLRGLGAALPALSRNTVSRSALLAQLSARPWALDGDLVAAELTNLAKTSTLDSLIADLATGPAQGGPSASAPVTIGWGRHDRLCLPVQATRAQRAFPGSRLVWFDHSGHFPMWDEPEPAAALMLEAT
jgi:pimeloyl-ACP methyl ester carboxylesterase